jgi:tetratricopeptide (TPR) repeat protein
VKYIIIALSFLSISAGSQDRYGHCIELTKTTPNAAYVLASEWRASGGGAAAMHCQALALLAQNEYQRAAGVLDAAATLLAKQADKAADLTAQAGNAWLLANDAPRAIARFTSALAVFTDNNSKRAEVLIDRARAYAAQENKTATLTDVSAAITLTPQNAEYYLLRAEIYLSQGKAELAKPDLAVANTLTMDANMKLVYDKLVSRLGPN